ncbi:DUF2637 domain-containing protein [Actinomadura sp. 9N215]|uniref:DUF2637 domain-containing protein n=1 Tax=Actinomadura sp. 9N215 TaxID=3375150 RepID=UPI0037B4A1AA
MPADPTRPSFTPAQRRLLTALAGLLVAALAGAAYALTYDVLRELALLGGVSDRWAPLYPAIADTLTAMTILSLAITRNARWWTRLLRWTLLLLLVAGGAAVAVQDSVWGMSELPRDAVRAGVAVAPHIMLVLAVWLWLTMFKQIRVARPAADDAAPVEPQRGHVKVLEPAAPEPLALEAPSHPEQPEPHLTSPDLTSPDLAGFGAGEADGPEADTGPEPPLPFLDDDPEPLIPFTSEEPQTSGPAPDLDVEDDAAETPERSPSPERSLSPDQSLSSEPDPPPLDTLPEPRPSLDPPASPPALLPTDVELVRTRDHGGAEERPVASTTRPDLVMPGPYAGDADEDHAQPADRAEDPDAGDAEDGSPARDVNPPPSSNFRSGPTPPAD